MLKNANIYVTALKQQFGGWQECCWNSFAGSLAEVRQSLICLLTHISSHGAWEGGRRCDPLSVTANRCPQRWVDLSQALRQMPPWRRAWWQVVSGAWTSKEFPRSAPPHSHPIARAEGVGSACPHPKAGKQEEEDRLRPQIRWVSATAAYWSPYDLTTLQELHTLSLQVTGAESFDRETGW